MIVSIQQHHAATAGAALTAHAANVIDSSGIVPAFLFHLDEVWKAGVSFGSGTFWENVDNIASPKAKAILRKNGLV